MDEREEKRELDKLRKNSEGYNDPTAFAAFENIDREERRFKKLLKTIFSLCELAGFELQSRLVLVDKRSGKQWK